MEQWSLKESRDKRLGRKEISTAQRGNLGTAEELL